jgi:hypothetical protein
MKTAKKKVSDYTSQLEGLNKSKRKEKKELQSKKEAALKELYTAARYSSFFIVSAPQKETNIKRMLLSFTIPSTMIFILALLRCSNLLPVGMKLYSMRSSRLRNL